MKINFSRYKRLLLVSCIPLLIIGAMFSYFSSSQKGLYVILCEPSFFVGENCRYVGGTDSLLYSSVKKHHASWFDIEPANKSKFLTTHIEASERMLRGATVLRARPFFGYPAEVASYMDELAGKDATIILGISDSSRRSMILGNNALLYCNNLSYKAKSNTYVSQCYGDGWGGVIEYGISGEGREMLSKLNASISEKIKNYDRNLIIYWVITTPIFLFGFLVLSLFLYLVAKAYNYVKGDQSANND